ncbi:S8 family serine peptidase [Streptomyces sp. NBC_01264]|uniref:S8 family serine peptidase n=1 Tax=Streptomyces sp. NBC_01264 TaxID=2903804 RepID=UPI0022519475|nr:S8 family serine peptidase [Streptomyces sp. NBC_01264]MCX4778034.1 S8 family serine peptidase [Streptomyces sp. NBC_01264]
MRNRARFALLGPSVLALLALAAAAPAAPAAVSAEKRDGRAEPYIVVLKDGAGDPATASKRLGQRYGAPPTAVFRHALKGYAARLTEAEATGLRADSAVRFVSKQRRYRLDPPRKHTPVHCGEALGGPGQCLPEWADRIEADRSSARSGDGKGTVKGVRVAVLDSGIQGTHPDLNVLGGTDCLSGSPEVPGTSLIAPDPHGTEAAGVIGAKDNGIGVVGVAPGAELWAVKIFPDDSSGLGSDEAGMCAMDWIVSTRTDGDPANDIHVANMSFTSLDAVPDQDDEACGTLNGDAFHLAVCNAVRAGITVVAGAGNESHDLARHGPAAYQEVLTATAMVDFDGKPGAGGRPDCQGLDFGLFGDEDDQAALEFSNFVRVPRDREHTVAAPGVCVATTSSDPAAPYTAVDGTSFSTPVVAGTAALCIAHGPCGHSTPARNLRTIVDDAARQTRRHPDYGFDGDPNHPFPKRYYGPLVHAGRY